MEEKLKLVQFSTQRCVHCVNATKYIDGEIRPHKDDYELVYLDGDEISEFNRSLAGTLKVRSVPHFAVINVEKREIVDDFTGFDRPLIHHYLVGLKELYNETEGKNNTEEEE